ncbi:N-acetylmuramoyl-L-alanine amidase [Synechococcus sp. Nb3U1]|uniref:N-acetylmuramoyl-L-alanine amidase n=1 Tax=Synechococcus sp. Nb3U1 TaxID=1914529 RepID=UPI001F2C1CEE|nr:N-acetylmuramoyl-L-alanine amidase [Synechococcus sp. Nb3U1]MCF2972471.1 N-acetylmuramoyl-L-alanine amidase [Synechococcus sp. Nb3U1]
MPELDKLGARRDPGARRPQAKQGRIGVWGSILLLGLAGAGLFPPQPALAQTTTTTGLSRIENWQYNPEQGRLEVNTQGEVRPFLFILQDPPRVVLDFPNTRFGRDPQTQTFSGRVGSLQISQLTDTITRFVLHLQPDQPLSLNQLQLLTANPSRWAVQFTHAGNLSLSPLIPSVSGSSAPPPLLTPPRQSQTPNLPLPPSTSRSGHQILEVSPQSEGFFIRTQGSPSTTVRRILDPDRVVIDFLQTSLSSALSQRAYTINRLGVSRLRIGQFEPTVARVVLDVDPSSGDWEARYDAQRGGIWIQPAGGGMQASLLPDATGSGASGPLATLQSVHLQGNQLTISADGFMFYRAGWDPASGGYRISVAPARLPQSLPDPGLPANGPVERIRFVQEDARTVSILVQPSEEFNVFEPNPGQGSRRITLQLQPLNAPLPIAQPQLPTQPQQPQPVGQPIIAIDAGHGGRDPGAIGVDGVQEKHITLSISNQVRQLLQERGYAVVMTRTDDREILLQPRVDIAVEANATLLVSIHANALDRSGISGIETYYLRPDSAELATTLHRSLVRTVGAADRGVRRARFFMVRETPTGMPSVLLELGYLTNPTEGRKLATAEYQALLSRAIADGIEAFLRNR